MKVAEIFAELGFQIKDENLGQFLNKLSDVSVYSIAAAAGLGGVYLALEKITTSAVEAAHALGNFSAQTGMSSEELQRWQQLGERIGITAQDVTNAFTGLQSAITAVKFGQGNIAPFQFFGIDPYKFTEDAKGMRQALMEIAAAYKTADPAVRRYWAGQMGLSDSMMQLLTSTKLTNEELDKMLIILDPARNQLNALRMAGVELGQSWRAFMNQIAVALEPALEGLTKLGIAFLDLARTSEPFRYVLLGILILLTALVAFFAGSFIGPLTAITLALATWAATLGEIVYYWDAITASIREAMEAANRFVSSPLGKILTATAGGLGGITNAFIPGNASNQNSQSNDNRQENHLTVNVGGQGEHSKGIVETIEDAWAQLMAKTAYQRKLKTT